MDKRYDHSSSIKDSGVSDTETKDLPVRHRLKSTDLFVNTREVLIEHHGEEYRLRLTSQGKLILTK